MPAGALDGIWPSQWIEKAVDDGVVTADTVIDAASIQPASLDLRLGEVAYRLRYSFLPGNNLVEDRLRSFVIGPAIDLTDGAILERNRPYLIPLRERLALPGHVRAKANPKSSTGRLDVFTRVITDRAFRFDEIRKGYEGRLFLEVVPRSFTVMVRSGLALNQLRLISGDAQVSDKEVRHIHNADGILFRNGVALDRRDVRAHGGLFVGLDLTRRGTEAAGFRARLNSDLIDMSRVAHYDPDDYWDPVIPEAGNRVVLEPEQFYLLLSDEAIRIPPNLAAEMTAFDPTSGELRTHYAGFFDPGFGYDDDLLGGQGSRAALEVRAHDVPFMVEHRQRVCKLTFERMAEEPAVLYGRQLRSHYQGQQSTLSKHFRVAPARD